MTQDLANGNATYEEMFDFQTLVDAGGGELKDPYPGFAELLAKGPVHKGSLAECLGLPVERNGGGYFIPGNTYFTVVSFVAVSDVFIRKDDFGVEAYLDTSEKYKNTASEVTVHGQRFLIVTQRGEIGGGQILFRSIPKKSIVSMKYS